MPYKKDKVKYRKGGVVGTAEYSKRPRYEYGGIVKKKVDPKRRGWSDHKDGYEKHEQGYKDIGGNAGGKEQYPKRSGWSDSKDGKEKREHSYKQRGGSAQNASKFKKRKGYSDHGDGSEKHHYEDGGVVKAKRNALHDLKNRMNEMGGKSLFDSLDNSNEFHDGGIAAKVVAKDKKGLKEGLKKAAQFLDKKKYEDGGIVDSDNSYDDLSREELLELLRNK